MGHALPRVPDVPHLQLAQLLPAQRVEQQRREDCAVALALQRVRLRRGQQFACLAIAEHRRGGSSGGASPSSGGGGGGSASSGAGSRMAPQGARFSRSP
jgi:hypothetical protein